MHEAVRAYYDNYKKAVVSLLLVLGLWRDDARQSRVLQNILSTFAVTELTILILFVLNFTVHNSRDILGLVAGISSIMSFSTAHIKVMVILVLWRDVKDLKSCLSALFEEDLKVASNREHLLAYYPAFYRFFRVHFYIGTGFVVFSNCATLWAALHGKYVRTFPIRVPFNYVPGDSLHWIIFVFEVTSSAVIAIITVGMDMVFGLFVFHMVGQMRLLSHCFRGLKPGKNYRRDLKHCVDKHCLLIDCKNKINKIFGIVSIWLTISCALIVCSIIFQLTQSKNVSLFTLIFGINYVLAKLLQAYTYAWYGNTVILESERCVESIYYCNWVEFGNVQIMKDLFIIRSQNPIYINAMGLMIVRMDMFIKIARASISYFFVLKTIEEKLAWCPLLLVTGLWPDDAKLSRVLRTILAAFVIVVLTIAILLMLSFTDLNLRNIFGLVAGISSIISLGSAYIKVIVIQVILVLWQDVKDLKCGLSALFEEDLKISKDQSYLLHYCPAFYRFFRVHYYSCAGFVAFSTCTTLWAAVHGKYVRTFAIRVPFDYVPGDSLYWIIFAFEVMSSAYLAIISIGVDTLFGLFSFHMVGKLRLLSYRFRSLKPGENYKRQLKECIDRHCLLINCKNKMNKSLA